MMETIESQCFLGNCPNDELSALINPKYEPKRKFQSTEKHVLSPPKRTKPSTNCKACRDYRTFPSVLGEGLEGESVDWKVRDGVSSQTIKVIISSANPHRQLVKEMLEMSSQSLAKKNILYYDYLSDSPVARNPRKLVPRCQTEDKPLILRHFARPGGMGTNDATRTIDGFLKYHADEHPHAKTYCQLESGDGGHYEWEELRKQFQLPPNARAYNANMLGVSLMNYQNLYTNMQFPEFLEHMDLLRRAAEMCDDPEKLSQGLKCVPELGFAVISMEGATTLPHEDNWPTFLIVHEGYLAVWIAKTSPHNQEMRLSWVPTDGLSKFQDSFTIDLQPGDILLIPAGTIHAAYSPEKKLMCGGHFVVPENLAETLRAATRHKIFQGSTNDESPRAREYFINMLEINSQSNESEVRGFWDYIAVCLEEQVKAEWKMPSKKINSAKSYLESLFGVELCGLLQD